MVDKRWAMIKVERFLAKAISSFWMARSVSESSAEVASSKIKKDGFFKRVLAIATRCFSPPDSFKPRSPTAELYPSGSDVMKS